MSSLRNSLHRRNHKERSQLSHRAKFGILEKHKDYVLRARDYHSKQDRIHRLRQKAAERNKDEFYFGMVNQKTKRGVHVQDRGNVSLPVDMVKVLKTQDENYIRTMRATGLKKIEKLKAQLTALADLIAPCLLNEEDSENELDETELEVLRQAGIIKAGKSSKSTVKRPTKHLIFVDNEDQARDHISEKKSSEGSPLKAPASDGEESGAPDLGWKQPKHSRKMNSSKPMKIDEDDERQRRETAKNHRTRLLKELSARLTRDTQLRYAERELAMQRMLMGHGGSMKLRGVEKVEGGEDEDELNEDELDSMKIKKSDRIKAKSEEAYKPRVYKWRLDRKK